MYILLSQFWVNFRDYLTPNSFVNFLKCRWTAKYAEPTRSSRTKEEGRRERKRGSEDVLGYRGRVGGQTVGPEVSHPLQRLSRVTGTLEPLLDHPNLLSQVRHQGPNVHLLSLFLRYISHPYTVVVLRVGSVTS